MSKLPVWIDCDTGVDDAVALILASGRAELDLVGVSTVAGNVELEKTTCNTLRLRDLLGASWPVYRGAAQPWLRPYHSATLFHGEDGLGGADLPAPRGGVEPETAWDAMYAAARARPGALEMVCVGPLTNLANAFVKYPDLPGLLKRVLIMGGAAVGGNTTPAAEFNIYVDPDAAQAVFRSGVKVWMFGLDVTLKAYLTAEDIAAIGALGCPVAEFVRDCTSHTLKVVTAFGLPGVSMHDACPIAYLLRPELFEGEEAGVFVETRSQITLGKTVTDLYSDHQFEEKNAVVMYHVDREAFVSLITETIRS